jgi:thiaminase/transcriptional activator TenA
MSLAQEAWKFSSKIVESIGLHPFSKQLGDGTLDIAVFKFFLEQDFFYLNKFAECNAIISAKVKGKYVNLFLDNAVGASRIVQKEREVVGKYLGKETELKKDDLSLATIAYVNFIQNICNNFTLEESVSVILPCLWLYKHLGEQYDTQDLNNSYYRDWIKTYTEYEFVESVEKFKEMFDELGRNATESLRNKMLDKFYKSMCLEWHFINDAYNRKLFDDLS